MKKPCKILSRILLNVSGIDRKKEVFVIKPSGISYDQLTPDKIVIVDLKNNVVGGKL